MGKIFLSTEGEINPLHVGVPLEYSRESTVIFECPICKQTGQFPLVTGGLKEVGTIDLKFPNTSEYTLFELRKFANKFGLLEQTYPKTGIHSFQYETAYGRKKAFIKLYRCKTCNSELAFCFTAYGDFSRFPGQNIILIGVEIFQTIK